MATKTLLRTVSLVDDVRAALSNSNPARLLNIGSTWNKLWVGVRLIVNGAATITGTPIFAMGVCSGVANRWNNGTALTDHFVGLSTLTSLWNYSGGDYFINSGSTDWRPTTRIGTTIAYGSGNVSTLILPTLTRNKRGMYFVDITKGSPNFTLNAFSGNNYTTAPDATVDQFLATVAIEACTFTGHGFGASRTIAVDEGANGTLDSIGFGWDRASPTIEICDVAVVRFS